MLLLFFIDIFRFQFIWSLFILDWYYNWLYWDCCVCIYGCDCVAVIDVVNGAVDIGIANVGDFERNCIFFVSMIYIMFLIMFIKFNIKINHVAIYIYIIKLYKIKIFLQALLL